MRVESPLVVLGASIAFLIGCGSTLADSPAEYSVESVNVAQLGSSRLDDVSITAARALTAELEVVGYFSENLSVATDIESYVRALLDEYVAVADGKIRVRFVSPSSGAQRQEAVAAGVPPVALQYATEDALNMAYGCAGLSFRYRGESAVIPTIDGPKGLEYAITLKIKELLGEKAVVGVVSHHGGPTIEGGLRLLALYLPRLFEFRAVALTEEVPSDIDALLILAPDRAFTETEQRRLNRHVMRGGSLGVFGAGAQLTLGEGTEAPTVTMEDMGLERVLARWGVTVRRDLVMDCSAGCQRVAMERLTPFGMIRAGAPYPPMPNVATDESLRGHPAVFQVTNAYVPFVSSLGVTPLGSGVYVTTLMRSSERSWRETAPDLTQREAAAWVPGSDAGSFPLLVAIEGNLPTAFASEEGPARSPAGTRVLVSGSSDYFMWRSQLQPEATPEYPMSERYSDPALRLASNNVSWLALETEFTALRSKSADVVVPTDSLRVWRDGRLDVGQARVAERVEQRRLREGRP